MEWAPKEEVENKGAGAMAGRCPSENISALGGEIWPSLPASNRDNWRLLRRLDLNGKRVGAVCRSSSKQMAANLE